MDLSVEFKGKHFFDQETAEHGSFGGGDRCEF